MARSVIQRARPTYGNAASVNSLVRLVSVPTSSSRKPSREPVQVNSSVTVAFSVRMAPQPYASADRAPFAIAKAEAGPVRALLFALLGVFTSKRLPHTGRPPTPHTAP